MQLFICCAHMFQSLEAIVICCEDLYLVMREQRHHAGMCVTCMILHGHLQSQRHTLLLGEAVAGLWTRCGVCCRLASKTDMLERLYDCLTALQQQYQLNREDGLYWQQTAQTTATQLAMTGQASLAHACRLHRTPADSPTQHDH